MNESLLSQLYLKDTAFQNLMQERIFNVLLVASTYDAFMLEEDGRVEEQIYFEYVSLNLSSPPRVTRVSDYDEAIEVLHNKHFDLIIAMPGVDLSATFVKAREIKQSQWQRLWLAPDMAAYKNQLAAKIYADVLHPDLPLDKGEYRKPARERPLDDEAQHSYVEKPQVEEAPKLKVTPRQVAESIQEVKPKEETVDADTIRKPETQEKPKAESQAKTKSETQTKKETGEESKNSSDVTLTPMTKQFLDLKQKHPDALLLFRCGDFYETYMQDGFPYHALDQYLPKLIRGGFRVAICDQLEPPQRQEQTVEHESPQQEENHSRRMRR